MSSHPKHHIIIVPLQFLVPMDTIELTVGRSPSDIKPSKAPYLHMENLRNKIRGLLFIYHTPTSLSMTTQRPSTQFQALLSDAS